MKKLNKLQKFLFAAFAISIGFFATVGISLNAMTACAEESTENTEILDDSATDEEIIVDEETSENSGVLDEETDSETDNSAILDEIKNYIDSRTDESGKVNWIAILTDVKFWIINVLEALGITGIVSLIVGLTNRKKNVLKEEQIIAVATAAAKKTAENVIGKSIDVDISAEVSKAVEQKMHALANTVGAMQESVKNAEMLMASVAMAQSKSKLLTEEESKALQNAAMKCAAHAGRKVVSTGRIELTAADSKTETKPTESVEDKNIHFLNFDGVKKQ